MKLKLFALLLQLTYVLSFNQCYFLKLNNKNTLNNINKKNLLICSVNILKSSLSNNNFENNNFNNENKKKK